ncbi:flavin reductase domain protein, FMN-binding [Thermosinus carboxydivorans Nor1]|uniref:Flavin reductase domain protein, FMN-binding n=1 Tax=Thermosinus carboxydivorans Nor1 TaxID=401526 RepID=A1HNM3_9FIRM|nr:flavin reductase family protein [Thermosinus carboxydivorans]EAX48382.1 flavin reductase domain protein, FMN-binding [Thermosinus carboxydivorans Nor1]
MKQHLTPTTLLFPLPTVLVSCAAPGFRPNITAIAWTGIVGARPPLVSICLRPDRYSYGIITASRQFIINIPTENQLAAIDLCGVVSGREVDKFAAAGFTPSPGVKVTTPAIAECPVNLECVLRETLRLGSHHTFIGEIVHIQADASVLTAAGTIDFGKLRPVTLNGAEYWGLGERKLADYGFTAKNK